MFYFFFFNDTATTEIYTLSLHDALPISSRAAISTPSGCAFSTRKTAIGWKTRSRARDRKSTRLNSSHSQISYAVFCLKKKKRNVAPRVLDQLGAPRGELHLRFGGQLVAH